jgi:hypothetical protein
MRLIHPITIDSSNVESSTADLTPNATEYGTDWQGEWESDYPAAAGTGYAEGDVVYKGVYIYESLEASNTDDPATSYTGTSASWLRIGMSNPWRMFDEYVNTHTEGPTPDANDESAITVVIEPTLPFDSIALFDLEANYIVVSLLDASDVELASTEYDLWQDVLDPADWYEYFFGDDILPANNLSVLIDDEVGWAKCSISIVNVSESEPAQCGMCVCGNGRNIGATQYEPEVSLYDYSKKETDDFGRTYLAQGAFAKAIRATLYVDNDYVDSTFRRVTSVRGTAVAWDFNEDETSYSMLVTYGFVQDLRVMLRGPNHSMCSLDIQGLI